MSYHALYREAEIPEAVRGDWSETADVVPVAMRRTMFALSSVDRFSPEVVREMRRSYYALISHVDYTLGHIYGSLRELGLLDNTTIIFTSDHGDMLGDHHLGGKTIYCEGSTHVPMLVRPAPALMRNCPAGGTTCDSLTCLVDVLPTFMGAAGLATPTGIDGRDMLADFARGSKRQYLIGEYTDLFMAMDQRYKYHWCVEGGVELLFDLVADPLEQHDLIRAGGHDDKRLELRQKLIEHLTATANPRIERGDLLAKPVRPLSRGGWPGFHTLAQANEVCH